MFGFFFFKQKTAYEMRISDWSSDVCSSDLLDECASLGRMAGLMQDLATLRRYRVWLWPVFQNIGQMKMLYRDGWNTIEANCGMRQYIAAHDAETAQHASNLCGTATVKTESSDSNGRKSLDRKSTRLNSSHKCESSMQSSA